MIGITVIIGRVYMKKIIFITGSMGRGGAERVISILSDKYARNGWDVQIGMLLHSYVEYDLNKSVTVRDLSDERGIRKGLFSTLFRIRKYIKDEKPEIVVTFMAQNCLLLGLATIGLKFRSIMSERIDPSMVKRNGIYSFLLNIIFSNADKVVFQTKRAKNYYSSAIQNKSIIIGNPIKVECNASPIKTKSIVSVGRLTAQKNQKMLIDAFSVFRKGHPDYKLIIYGEGELRQELEHRINELNLQDAVFLPGNSRHIHNDISDAEMFVLSSDFEGLSNALLEAMMMGIPTISTNCAGSDEVIESYKNGLLIPIGDVKALTNAIEYYFENKDIAKKMASLASKEIEEKYSVEEIISKWQRVIEG